MGVADILGGAIDGPTLENTLSEDGDAANTFRAFTPTQSEETYPRLSKRLCQIIRKILDFLGKLDQPYLIIIGATYHFLVVLSTFSYNSYKSVIKKRET